MNSQMPVFVYLNNLCYFVNFLKVKVVKLMSGSFVTSSCLLSKVRRGLLTNLSQQPVLLCQLSKSESREINVGKFRN